MGFEARQKLVSRVFIGDGKGLGVAARPWQQQSSATGSKDIIGGFEPVKNMVIIFCS
jgi:hypothetical protein